jgi:hypothetical protein
LTWRAQPLKLTFTAPADRAWPGGDCIDLATLDLEESEIEARFGLSLERGVEVGLGDWVALGGRMPSGRELELIRYLQAPGARCFIVRVDAGADLPAALDEVLAIASIRREALLWVSPRVGN